jgi:hypothetical protein
MGVLILPEVEGKNKVWQAGLAVQIGNTQKTVFKS